MLREIVLKEVENIKPTMAKIAVLEVPKYYKKLFSFFDKIENLLLNKNVSLKHYNYQNW